MAGRPSKPVQLIKLEGNKDRRTKAELAHREKFEKSLYTGTSFKEIDDVKSDPVAHKKFLQLKKLYKSIQYIDGLDEQIINEYCLLVSEGKAIKDRIKSLENDEKNIKDPKDRIELYKVISKLNNDLNKNRDLRLKYEDRLFLNPTARVKSIPKTPEETKQSKMSSFLQKRGVGHGS